MTRLVPQDALNEALEKHVGLLFKTKTALQPQETMS